MRSHQRRGELVGRLGYIGRISHLTGVSHRNSVIVLEILRIFPVVIFGVVRVCRCFTDITLFSVSVAVDRRLVPVIVGRLVVTGAGRVLLGEIRNRGRIQRTPCTRSARCGSASDGERLLDVRFDRFVLDGVKCTRRGFRPLRCCANDARRIGVLERTSLLWQHDLDRWKVTKCAALIELSCSFSFCLERLERLPIRRIGVSGRLVPQAIGGKPPTWSLEYVTHEIVRSLSSADDLSRVVKKP